MMRGESGERAAQPVRCDALDPRAAEMLAGSELRVVTVRGPACGGRWAVSCEYRTDCAGLPALAAECAERGETIVCAAPDEMWDDRA